MPPGMTGEKIQRQQDDVEQQNQGPESNPNSVGKEKSFDRVMPKEDEEDNRQVHEIAMDILQDEGKPRLAGVVALSLRHGATWRIEKERTVIRFAVVVAGRAEPKRSAENEQRRRIGPIPVMHINQRRIKR